VTPYHSQNNTMHSQIWAQRRKGTQTLSQALLLIMIITKA
jgi:hypothetical protein